MYRTIAAVGRVLGVPKQRVLDLIERGPLVGRIDFDGVLKVEDEDLAAFRRPLGFATSGDKLPPDGSEVGRSANRPESHENALTTGNSSLIIGLCGDVGGIQLRRGTMATRGFRALLDVEDVRRQGDRFRRFVSPEPNTGCHIWTGCFDRRFEYGQFKLWPQKVIAMAHRVAWVIANGRIPERMEVDHLCRHRWCVNVQHLELATRLENLRRRDAHLASLGTHNMVAAHAARARRLSLVAP